MSTQDYLGNYIRWVEHRGHQILVVHYRGLGEAEMIASLNQTGDIIRDAPGKVRVLVDLEGTSITGPFMDRVKQLGKEIIEAKAEKQGYLGITGIKLIFVQAYNRLTGGGHNQKFFKTEAEALDWLAS